jgi:hypothetical protein
MFRAIWSHDVNDLATTTTMNILPFGRLTKDVLTAYQKMATELLAGIPLQRIDSFYTKAKKQQKRLESLEEEKANLGERDELSVQEELERLR